jgi:division protein CdvB (Snf7/Vps24/ESCRT-III family)|tara:strand:- start:494 stop:754 length:261 start_codon:yes stop_codon:yes gene_type:complete
MIRRMVNGNKTPRTKKINTIENQISKIINDLNKLREREGQLRTELIQIQKQRRKLENRKSLLQSVEKNIIYPGRKRKLPNITPRKL